MIWLAAPDACIISEQTTTAIMLSAGSRMLVPRHEEELRAGNFLDFFPTSLEHLVASAMTSVMAATERSPCGKNGAGQNSANPCLPAAACLRADFLSVPLIAL
jgi:hypothetical protein